MQLDFWNEPCQECDDGVPFVHPVHSIGLASHWMNWRDGETGRYNLRLCIRGVTKKEGS